MKAAPTGNCGGRQFRRGWAFRTFNIVRAAPPPRRTIRIVYTAEHIGEGEIFANTNCFQRPSSMSKLKVEVLR